MAILRVNRSIHEQTTSLLYGHGTFESDSSGARSDFVILKTHFQNIPLRYNTLLVLARPYLTTPGVSPEAMPNHARTRCWHHSSTSTPSGYSASTSNSLRTGRLFAKMHRRRVWLEYLELQTSFQDSIAVAVDGINGMVLGKSTGEIYTGSAKEDGLSFVYWKEPKDREDMDDD